MAFQICGDRGEVDNRLFPLFYSLSKQATTFQWIKIDIWYCCRGAPLPRSPAWEKGGANQTGISIAEASFFTTPYIGGFDGESAFRDRSPAASTPPAFGVALAGLYGSRQDAWPDRQSAAYQRQVKEPSRASLAAARDAKPKSLPSKMVIAVRFSTPRQVSEGRDPQDYPNTPPR